MDAGRAARPRRSGLILRRTAEMLTSTAIGRTRQHHRPPTSRRRAPRRRCPQG
ncbi:hypothetical protein QJS66_09050 [Kocuria rhizophila]|nr:hypothetical protein QJS66_09050 [Kocuria rhizophila]